METEIFTCKYFKFGRNTTGLSQSHLRNFLACSIRFVILMPLYFYPQMLWEYKQTFSKDQKFERAVQDRFCVADLNLVIFVTMFQNYYHPY